MADEVLEREAALAALESAMAAAEAGHGSLALVTGEAGIGKTSLVRAFAARTAGRARVLRCACDDLIAPRTLGPLHDAAAGTRGPLAKALEGPADGVFAAVLEELKRPPATLLVVEDVHWADDATLDVLAYAARRVDDVGALVVLTFRDGEVEGHPALQRLLGTLAGGPLHRVALDPLSREAVARLARRTGADAGAVHRITLGNPFFVTEVLAAPPGDVVPASVVDAVHARVGRLSAACREALDQLSVVPSRLDAELSGALLGPRLEVLAEAELAGVVEADVGGVAFRHELARRAVEQCLPAIRRRLLNAEVVRALRAQARPERARLMHHAVAAGDVGTMLAVGPAAAQEAARAGSHRQALAHFEALRPHLARLPEAERAAVLDDHGWELYNAHRFREAIEAGREAAALYERLGDDVALARCLVRLSRHLFMAGETDAAEESTRRAVRLLKSAGRPAELAQACLGYGSILAMTSEPERALQMLAEASRLAARAGRADLAALCLNYEGIARTETGDPEAPHLLRRSIATAQAAGAQEYAARGYTNLAEVLLRAGRMEELAACVRDGLAFCAERGFWSHAYNLEVHRCIALLYRGEWDTAITGLRRVAGGVDEPGMLYGYSIPWLGRALARRGEPGAGELLADAWERARRERLLLGLAYAGIAYAEWAWLAGRPDVARGVGDELLPLLRVRPGAAAFRGELLRYLARAGLPAPRFARCPEPFAAGLRGDWRAAARSWESAGRPYERALELAESGQPEPTLEALRVLDELGAAPAAARVRDRLRAMGTRVPRGPRRETRTNPAGLTERQLDVLELLAEGLTNAEIARRLVVSVRTVDHHVAAVLAKLGVHSRQDAAAAYLESVRVPAWATSSAASS